MLSLVVLQIILLFFPIISTPKVKFLVTVRQQESYSMCAGLYGTGHRNLLFATIFRFA